MNALHLTVAAPAQAFNRLTAEEIAAAQLQGRCTGRIRYAQTATPAGERAYGHFAMDADALADALGRQISPQEANAAHAVELTLHRWLRDHDHSDEADEPAATLPTALRGLEPIVEELFSENEARVFCTCCNRNLARRDVRLERTSRPAGAARYRYLCAEGHLLLELPATAKLTTEARAA